MGLGKLRADAVRAALVARGADASQMVVSNAGSSAPVDDNATTEGRRNNRRVEIRLMEPP